MWTHVASAASDASRLELYERDGVYMLRADGWELMNGAYHASEDALGRIAGRLAGGAHPAVLLGGLGLGYTLASLLQALRARRPPIAANITVAERSGAVLRWFATCVNPGLAAALPPGVRLLESDVADQLGADRRWDVIVLDVDNGPQALSAPGNETLYHAPGLARLRDSLAPGGRVLLWSGFDDPGFVARAAAAGFRVGRRAIALPNRVDAAHLLYALSLGRRSGRRRASQPI